MKIVIIAVENVPARRDMSTPLQSEARVRVAFKNKNNIQKFTCFMSQKLTDDLMFLKMSKIHKKKHFNITSSAFSQYAVIEFKLKHFKIFFYDVRQFIFF